MARKSKHDKDKGWQEELSAKPSTTTATLITEPEAEGRDKEPKTDYSDRTKHGVVLTGGIDSTVMLHKLKNELPEDAEIIPIVLGSNKKDVTPILNELGISTASKSFNIDDEDSDESKMLPLIEWALENNIFVVHFSANHDEQEHSLPGKTFDYFARLNDLSEVNISTPFITVTKEKIIQDAVDKYGIDLSQLAEPLKVKEGDKISESSAKIRQEGFEKAFSVKYDKWIPDPFAPEEEDKGEEEGK